jgi:hypothetical protein
MTSGQNPSTAGSTTRVVIDRFNEAFNRHDADALAPLLTDVFTVRDGKVAAKLAYVKG